MAEKTSVRLVFMGTPPFAATILTHLAAWPLGKIVAVLTQPDRPAKRGHKMSPSAVKTRALELKLPVLQPISLKDTATVDSLTQLQPDFLLVAAYGLLLPQKILSLPKYPPLNVHASLLPKYRGAAPVQRAILEGVAPNACTGVSIMQMVQALDAGPVYAKESLLIGEHTADSLLDALAPIGSNLLLKVLEAFLAGTALCTPQDANEATYAAKLDKKSGEIAFTKPAREVHAQIRAVTSKPGAQIVLHVQAIDSTFTLKILPGRITDEPCAEVAGSVRRTKDTLEIACTDYWYQLLEIKPQGKAFMSIKAFLNGYLRHVPEGVCGMIAGEE